MGTELHRIGLGVGAMDEQPMRPHDTFGAAAGTRGVDKAGSLIDTRHERRIVIGAVATFILKAEYCATCRRYLGCEVQINGICDNEDWLNILDQLPEAGGRMRRIESRDDLSSLEHRQHRRDCRRIVLHENRNSIF